MYPTVEQLLPGWLRAVWVVLLAAVVLVQGWHALRGSGQQRAWHAVYALVALAMVVMYAFNPLPPTSFGGVGLLVFVLGALGVVALALVVASSWRRAGRAPVLWLVALVDTVTLTYIQIPAGIRPVIVCIVFAAYCVVQMVLRILVAVRAARGAPQSASRHLVDPSGLPAGPEPRTGATGGTGEKALARPEVRTAVALAVLAAGMLYMLSV